MNSRSLRKKSVTDIENSQLTPTLQQLARDGVTTAHFDRVRQDRGFAERIAEAFKTGGWQLTQSEMEAFHLFGEEVVYLAPEVNKMWCSCLDHVRYPNWNNREVYYRSNILQGVLSAQNARLVNSASSGVASKEPETDWRLFYIKGETLLSMIQKMFQFHLPGLDRDKLQALLNAWPSSNFESAKPGYYLINVSPVKDHKWCNSDRRKYVSPLIMLEAHITHYLLRNQWGFVEGDWGVCAFMNKPGLHSSALVELCRNKPTATEPPVSYGIDYWPKGPQTMGAMAMVEPAFPVV